MRMMLAGFAVAVFAALALASGCGGRQMLDLPPADSGAAGTGASPFVGPIDLTAAPPTLSMSCDHGFGTITFVNPCLVGGNLAGSGSQGPHDVECTVGAPNAVVGWSFLVNFPPLQNPETLLPLTPNAAGVVLGDGRKAAITMIAGALTFSRVDAVNRAFVASFNGKVSWIDSTGATFTCAVDAPLWGAPGGFD